MDTGVSTLRVYAVSNRSAPLAALTGILASIPVAINIVRRHTICDDKPSLIDTRVEISRILTSWKFITLPPYAARALGCHGRHC